MSLEEQKRQLNEMRQIIRQHREKLKPLFGYMFWNFQALNVVEPPPELTAGGVSLTMIGDEDEWEASFIAHYVQLWQSSNDFNAASRFIASCLEISADELIQCREVWLKNPISDGF